MWVALLISNRRRDPLQNNDPSVSASASVMEHSHQKCRKQFPQVEASEGTEVP